MSSPQESLHYAAEKGDIPAVQALLTQVYELNAFDEISYTPLHYAAVNGHLQIMRMLLAAGADVNAHDEARAGDSPLGAVAGNCTFAVAKVLVDAGADPTLRGGMQICALDRAKDLKKEEGRKVHGLLGKAARNFQ